MIEERWVVDHDQIEFVRLKVDKLNDTKTNRSI
jgi:hypothetical protein